eukprot:TRINITY_DN3300_c0_g1_i7.p1 TRINITY_DN3300_c0_g1~~TRINITY_DN3300_c0_g1_i7.p1  ORF type:complete len:159 (-),score=35.49 TRINITY_DN3300_c0_g1_i7:34-510(-)
MTLAHRHAFGIKADVKDNLAYTEEATIVFPAGNNVVICNVDQKTQRFIAGGAEKTEGITCMCVAPTLKYIAVGERGDKPYVSVYDLSTLKRRRLLWSPDVTAKEYVCLSFSQDHKPVSYTHLRAHETPEHLVCRLLLEKKKKNTMKINNYTLHSLYIQ